MPTGRLHKQYTPQLLQDEGFSLNLHLNMCGCLKFAKPERSELCEDKLRPASPNHHVKCALYWDIKRQRVGNSYRHFRDKLWAPFSNVKKLKTENRNNWSSQTLSFFGDFVHSLTVYRIATFRKLALFPFSGREAPGATLRFRHSHWLHTAERVTSRDVHLRTDLIQG